ncbi:hypothetical protein GOP47_0020534 [Adiantum capillus-veneris]|uniref:PIH1D1/2/3 CS-like domain-containing protein n=1 Tax=Adiantum capillus-veneris TaxID=13818 RepID=A0A9D4Z726_ADICA|nr:hypothetical protein GOP47_0020534 [Adiantum capillus-veneris]
MPSPAIDSSTTKHDVSLAEAVVAKKDLLKPSDSLENSEHAGVQSNNKLEGHAKPTQKIVGGAMEVPLREPKYEIIYSNGLDLGKFWMDNNIDEGNKLERPKEILLRVLLPEVVTATEVELDVSDTQALLVVRGLYKLQVKWRYTVDSAKGSAKFDKATHKLEVPLYVQKLLTQVKQGINVVKFSVHLWGRKHLGECQTPALLAYWTKLSALFILNYLVRIVMAWMQPKLSIPANFLSLP